MADAKAEVQPSAGYTLGFDGDNLTLPLQTPRLAVLIGNGSYDKAPPPKDGDSDKLTLDPLTRPCDDVKAVAGALSKIGWQKQEIVVLCNQTNGQIYSAISALLSVSPLEPSKPRLVMLYLAGHGMLVDSRNYFFGIDTRVDWQDKFNQLKEGVAADSDYQLFDKSDGVDIRYAFSGLKDKLSFPLLIVVDACRDNPFIAYINRESDKARHEPNTASSPEVWKLMLDRVSSIAKATNPPRGMEYLYAAKPNATIQDDDGKGHSRLVEEFLKTVSAGELIRKLIFKMQDDLDHVNMTIPKPEWQTIDYEGELYAGGDWCFFGCELPGDERAVAQTVYGQPYGRFRHDARLLPAYNLESLSSPSTQNEEGLVNVIRRYPVGSPRRVLIDIRWCSGNDIRNNRRNDARQLADSLGKVLDSGNQRLGNSEVYAIRLSEITSRLNNTARYQRRKDTLYVDNVHREPEENALARKFIRPLLPHVDVRETDEPTKDYIEVSFCRDAFVGTRAPRIFVQVATAKSLPVASSIMSAMDTASPDLSLDPTPENVSSHRSFLMEKYPNATEIRISDPRLKARAKRLSGVISPILGQPVPVLCYARCKRNKPGSAIEVWVGQLDSVKLTPKHASSGARSKEGDADESQRSKEEHGILPFMATLVAPRSSS